jgi:hypothetical protein
MNHPANPDKPKPVIFEQSRKARKEKLVRLEVLQQ